MANGHDIIVVGASGGGVEAASKLVAGLPETFPAALCLVVHIDAAAPRLLAGVLDRAGPLPAITARDGELIQPGRIYVGPPDYHLLLTDGALRLTRSPRENRHRPAVDPLFRSAARSYGPRVIGVVLTGSFDDGASGLAAIKARGGIAVVQDPMDALFPGMPESALREIKVDHCVPLRDLAALLVRLASTPVAAPAPREEPPRTGAEAPESLPDAGRPSMMSCPTCHGVLWESDGQALPRYVCRIGHTFSFETLLAEQAEDLETVLWGAVRALRESAAVEERVAAMSAGSMAQRHAEAAAAKTAQARTLRKMILGTGTALVVEGKEDVVGCSGQAPSGEHLR